MSTKELGTVEVNNKLSTSSGTLPDRPVPGSIIVRMGNNVFVPRMPSDPPRRPSPEERDLLG